QPTSSLFPYTTLFRSHIKAWIEQRAFCGFSLIHRSADARLLSNAQVSVFQGVGRKSHISEARNGCSEDQAFVGVVGGGGRRGSRSEEHTSELQSPCNL